VTESVAAAKTAEIEAAIPPAGAHARIRVKSWALEQFRHGSAPDMCATLPTDGLKYEGGFIRS